MYKHGSLLALFLFLQDMQGCRKQICGSPHAVWNGNPYGTIPFFVRSNEPAGDACIHGWRLPHQRAALLRVCQKCLQRLYRMSGWIKQASGTGEKKKGGKKNE